MSAVEGSGKGKDIRSLLKLTSLPPAEEVTAGMSKAIGDLRDILDLLSREKRHN